MKRVFLIISFLFMIAFTFGCKKNLVSKNLEFNLGLDGTYEVSLKSTSKSTKIVIPKKYNGKEVTVLEGFKNNDYIVEINISKNITKIEETALTFCKNLSRIIVDSDNEAFYSKEGNLYDKNDTLLRFAPGTIRDTFSCSAKKIASYAFTLSSLTKVAVSADYIEEKAFYCMDSIKDIYILSKDVEINKDMIMECPNLKMVYINALNQNRSPIFNFNYNKQGLKNITVVSFVSGPFYCYEVIK